MSNEVIDLTDDSPTHVIAVLPRRFVDDAAPIGIDICPDVVNLIDESENATCRILDYQFDPSDFAPPFMTTRKKRDKLASARKTKAMPGGQQQLPMANAGIETRKMVPRGDKDANEVTTSKKGPRKALIQPSKLKTSPMPSEKGALTQSMTDFSVSEALVD